MPGNGRAKLRGKRDAEGRYRVTVRAIRPGDASAILQAFRGLGRESVYRRFLSPKKDLSPAELEQLASIYTGPWPR